MPIVTHKIETADDATKDRHVVLRMYDQDGREYMLTFWLAVGVDLTTLVNNRIAEQNVQLAESEFETMVGAE